MATHYAFQSFNKEHMARAMGKDLPVSTKMSVELCRELRGKEITKAKKYLNDIASLKKALPLRRHNQESAHQREVGPGRFPVKAALEFLELIELVEANAQFKGLNTSNLSICHICAHKAQNTWHYGRLRRRKMKRTHLEIVVCESQEKKGKKGSQSPKAQTKKSQEAQAQ